MMEGDVRLVCLVDNVVPPGSACKKEHGLSILVETGSAKVLMDTGASGTVLAHNASVLPVYLDDVAAIVLSHGHRDHTGGLEVGLRLCPSAGVHTHPDAFAPHYGVNKGKRREIGPPMSVEALARRRPVYPSRGPVQVAPGVWTTGEIPRGVTPGTIRDHLLIELGGRIQVDTFPDDQSLVVETGEGVVLVLGCCHSGLRNTLLHVVEAFGRPVRALVGGGHLKDEPPEEIGRIVALLHDEFPETEAHLNHCAGEKVVETLRAGLGERAHYFPAGASIIF